jgi:hypothetical protein
MERNNFGKSIKRYVARLAQQIATSLEDETQSSASAKDSSGIIMIREGRIFPGGGVSGPTVIMPPGYHIRPGVGSSVPPLPWQREPNAARNSD